MHAMIILKRIQNKIILSRKSKARFDMGYYISVTFFTNINIIVRQKNNYLI